MRHELTLMVLVAGLAVGCGGNTDADGKGGSSGSGGSGASSGSGGNGASAGIGGSSGSGGSAGLGGASGSGGAAGLAGSGGMPPECAVPTSEPGPYAVNFRFTNASPNPLYVLEECRIRFDVLSCADGYQAPLSLWADCTVSCEEAPTYGCIACDACMWQGLAVTSASPAQADWPGTTFTFSQTPQGCQCNNSAVAPAGNYSIRVPVYATKEAAESLGQPMYTVEVPFALPAPNGVVEVPLVMQYDAW